MAQKTKEQRRKKVMEVLNKARSMELKAITQYMNQHYNLDDMDYGEMAAKVKLIAIDEMRHAEIFAERIKELGGEPTTEPDGKTAKGQKIQTIFSFDAKLEDDTIDAYNQFLLVCRENGDSTSVNIFEAIIDEERVHFNYFDNVNSHIEKFGETYLAQIAGTSSATGLQTQGFVARQGSVTPQVNRHCKASAGGFQPCTIIEELALSCHEFKI
ncbi:MAG: bacterioferritin [Deltaproteobacteria bacterium]|nr:bacterioferritin [Deltaproteobacteria bacterium]